MSKVDIVTKDYMKDARRFADAFNYYLFNGEQIVRSEMLQVEDPVELGVFIEGGKDKFTERLRDLIKQAALLSDGKYRYLLLGLENQDKVHTAMPVKNLIMDALRYAEQVSERKKERKANKEYGDSSEFLSGFGKEDKLKPVITLVIYWGDEAWDGPRCLYDMFDDMDERVKAFINDYKIHIIVPNEIEDFTKFDTELGLALEFIAVSGKEEGIRRISQDGRFSKVSNETVNLLNICTGAQLRINGKGDTTDMCKGIEDMKKTERNAGIQIEFVNALDRIAKNVGGIAEACKLYGTTEEEYWRVKNRKLDL